MKTAFGNRTIIKYCLNNPLSAILIMVGIFISILFVDQSLKSYNSITEKETIETISKLNSLSINYVAWCSSNPAIISYFKDDRAEPNVVEHYGYFASFKIASQKIISYVELQLRLLKRIIELAN